MITIYIGQFKNPITPYFYSIDCQTNLKTNTFSVNNINLNLAVVNSHQSYFIDKVKKTYASVFQRTNINSMNKVSDMSNVLSAFVFFEKDRLQVYERIYDGLLDLLSDVGGIYQIIIGVLSFINIIFSEYMQFKDAKYLYEKYMRCILNNVVSKQNSNHIKNRVVITIANNVSDSNNINNRSFPIKSTINHNDEECTKKYNNSEKNKNEILEFLKYF